MAAIALRNLWARKLRTFLTGFAVVLGVMMIAGTYVLTDTIERSFDQIFTTANEGVDAVVTAKEVVKSDDGSNPSIPASVLDEVQKVDGVGAAEGTIADSKTAIIGSDGDPIGGNGAPGLAFSTGLERFDPLSYEEGGPPQADDEVAIDVATAENQGFELGDEVTISGAGETRKLTVTGTAKLGDSESLGGATISLMTLPTARAVTGKQGQFDQITVAADDSTTPERLAANLSAALPSSLQAQTGEENTDVQKQDINEGIGFLKTALLVFAGVSLFVASFLIFNTFSITVAQRTREFAMLRTLGANRRQIVTSVIGEALAIGLVASGIGLLAGIGFASVLEGLFKSLEIDLPKSGTVVEARTIIIAVGIGTFLTVASALAPALRATRVPPVEGLREGAVLSTPREGRIRAGIGVVLALVGMGLMAFSLFGALGELTGLAGGSIAVFIGVSLLSPKLVEPLAAVVGVPLRKLRGVPGRIAHENSIRNPGRTASTAAALMIGVALVSFVAIFAAGLKGSIEAAIDETITAELYVANQDGFSDIPVASAASFAALDGVEAASPTRYTSYAEADDPASDGSLTLINPPTAAQVLDLHWTDGGSQDLLTSMGPNDAVFDDAFAEDAGIEAGDTFGVLTASGERIDYTVAGTFEDKTDYIGDYAASDVNAAAYGEGATASSVLIKVDPDVDIEAVRAEVDETAEAFPTTEVQNQQELKDSIGAELDQLLGGVYGLLFLAVIVSLFGIVNTLALTIHERTRELGLLRAVGTSRRQVRQIVRYEAVITALIGAVLGSVLGVIFAILISRPLTGEGFTLVIPWATLAVLLLLSALAGVLAAIAPARRASRIDTLEALSYE